MPLKYAADFETTTVVPTKVWCWGVACVDTPEVVETGRDIEDFLEWCSLARNPIIYFHNEKFDGSFIIDYLLRNGFEWRKTKGECSEKEFTTIIDEFGKFYAIEIYWKRKNKKPTKCTIYDSYKIIPMGVDTAAKKFGLKMHKLHIDYDRHNTECDITADEWEYLRHDVSIMAQVLQIAFQYGLTRMTLAGCCMHDYKESIGGDDAFRMRFPSPPIEVDLAMRAAYKGGWTYVNPDNAGKEVGEGLVFDVNSLYPSQMAYRPLPYGIPMTFTGKYDPSRFRDYPLYIQIISCEFDIKKHHLPTIQIKNSPFYKETEYLTSSDGTEITLTLASPDLELFLKHYDVDNLKYLGGWAFRARNDLFTRWVEKWANVKIEADKSGNSALRQIAKLYMNNLYGRFALNPKRKSKYPVFSKEKDCVMYKKIMTPCTYADGTPQLDENGQQMYTDYQLVKPVYIPVGIFVTAWARYVTINAAQKIHYDSIMKTGRSRFCYADTDSVHIIGTELPEGLDIDPYRLGAWKCESHFSKAKFIQAKRYIEMIEGELNVKCAGLPADSHKFVTFENFNRGMEYPGKLIPKIVPGGTILTETKFKMR